MTGPILIGADHVDLLIKATPAAKKRQIKGVQVGADGQSRLLVHVTEPPDKDRANKAIVKYLAEISGLSKSQIRLITGAKGRLKTLRFMADSASIMEKFNSYL